MKILTFAAGLAAGYVLGTRAGREKYEQIAAGARKAANHPTVVQAQEKAKDLISTGTDAVTTRIASTTADEPGRHVRPTPATTPATTPPTTPAATPAAPAATTKPSAIGDPLA